MIGRLRRLVARRDVDSLDNRDAELIAQVAELLEPVLRRWFRYEVRGLERVPDGAALFVGNHSGGFVTPDTWILGVALLRERGIDDVPYGLGHQVVVEGQGLNQLLTRIGAVAANADNAHRVFASGHKVLVYPGGDLDAFRASRDRDRVIFGPRRGYVRLALREGVPIVPVVAAGAHHGWWVLSDGRWLARRIGAHRLLRTDVLPITLSIPWGLSVGIPVYVPVPTRVLIEVLEPIRFERRGEEAARDEDYVEACHRLVIGRMQASLDALSAERRRAKR